jgi:hypothetical protein
MVSMDTFLLLLPMPQSPSKPPPCPASHVTLGILAVMFLVQTVASQEPTCKQLKTLGYLKTRAAKLESDPELEARLQELIVEDIRGKLDRNLELAKCVEGLDSRRPAPSPSVNATRGHSSATSSSSNVPRGVIAAYVITGLFLGLWGALVVR